MVIRDVIQDKVAAVVVTESLHLINYMKEQISWSDVFSVEDGEVGTQECVWKVVASDNYDSEDAEDIDALVLVREYNMPEYLVQVLNRDSLGPYYFTREVI